MAAVSSSSRSTTLDVQAISASRKLRFSQIPSSYTQICSIEDYKDYKDPLVINTLMHTVKNICKIKDEQHANYFLIRSDQEDAVMMCVSGKRDVTILGYNFKLGVFFGHHADEIPFYRMVNSFKQPLTEEQNRSITDTRCQYSLEVRTMMAQAAQDLFHFAPPRIFCDMLEDTVQEPKTHIKWLPPSETLIADFSLKELVCRNQGLFFGHEYTDIVEIAALFKSIFISQLSQLEVQHLYLELPAADLYQQFALFNVDDPQHKHTDLFALEKRLKTCRVHNYKKILEICLIAKMHNIQVWPVDISFNELSEISSLEIALTQRDRVMLKNIQYYSSLLPEGKKYVGLFGEIHYRVGLDLGIPNIRIMPHSEFPIISHSESSYSKELDESKKQLYELNIELYSQLTEEQKLQVENSADVVLKILPSNKEFSLELPKKE